MTRMSKNFGFIPDIHDGERYCFISYDSGDSVLVSGIARSLNKIVKVWYDHAIPRGNEWSIELETHIKNSDTMLIFETKKLFKRNDSWVVKEFEIAKSNKVNVVPVFVDKISEEDVSTELHSFWKELNALQGVDISSCQSGDECAFSIAEALGVIESPKINVQTIKINDIITMGHYSCGGSDKPIQWRVMEVFKDRVLLLSDSAIENKAFCSSGSHSSWSTSTLREWLNTSFIDTAFSPLEKRLILGVYSVDDKQSDTKAQNTGVFCLSVEEADRLFRSDSDRVCISLLLNNNGNKKNKDNRCVWWLRSNGIANSYAAVVDESGKICRTGLPVTLTDVSVRPAIYISI